MNNLMLIICIVLTMLVVVIIRVMLDLLEANRIDFLRHALSLDGLV